MRPSNRDEAYPYPHDPYAGDELSDGESSEVDDEQNDSHDTNDTNDTNEPYDSDDRKK